MAEPVYEKVYTKGQFANEKQLESFVARLSKRYPQLVFVWPCSILRVWIQGYKRRSDITADVLELHLQWNDYFLQNGGKVYPTPAQLAKIQECAYSRE